MSLFKKLNDILTTGCKVTIVVTKAQDGTLSAATVLDNSASKDPAKAYIQPFIVTGTPDELDEGFADAIGEPLARSAGLQTSMAQFEASTAVAAARSKAAIAKKADDDKAKKQRKAAFDKAYAKAEALEKEGKLTQAIAAYKEAAAQGEGADKAKAEKKARDLQAKDQPSLDFFGSTEGDSEETAEPEAVEEGDNQ